MKFRNPADPTVPVGIAIHGVRNRFIDGLRAVSILAVVFFHVGVPGFSGGFIGVDVFFVISGYLIITQIIGQLERGTFALADFWARRALRILPPFALVTGVTIALAGWLLVMPTEIRDFGNSVAYASAMIANYFFYAQQGYFDTAANLKPLLHTWTLSVEEQFYVVAPLLLVALFWVQMVTKRPAIFVASTVVLGASLAMCIFSTAPEKNAAFYLMQYRAWEFVAGGLVVAIVPLVRRAPRECCELGAVIGLAAIAGPLTVYRVLATFPFVAIGLISYSWYLWHWPLLSFARIYGFGPHQIRANFLAA